MEAQISKPKAPTPPSPEATAKAQTTQTQNTAVANNTMGMVNQVGPDGSLKYNQVGGYTDPQTGVFIPKYEAVTALSDVAQKRYDTTNDATQNMADIAKLLSSKISNTAGNEVSMDNLPALPGSGGYEASRKSVEDALYSRLNPQLAQARDSLATRLANSGIRIGSAAYDRAMQNQGMTENDARQQVVLAGGQEQSRLGGMDSAARAQLLQERNQAANEPINRMSALLSQSQVNTPQYQTYTPTNMATTDVAGITQQGFANQQATYAQQMAQQNALIGAAAGLGGAALTGGLFGGAGAAAGGAAKAGGGLGKGLAMFSDRRLKKDIEKVGKADGHNLYEYRYINEDGDTPKHTGVMAQEVEKTRPDAVTNTPTGKMVHYGKLFGLGAGI